MLFYSGEKMTEFKFTADDFKLPAAVLDLGVVSPNQWRADNANFLIAPLLKRLNELEAMNQKDQFKCPACKQIPFFQPSKGSIFQCACGFGSIA